MFLALSACGHGRAQPVPKPSILLITIDTLRADHVGCYGYASARTPSLDRLAAAGVRFEEARSQVPLTAPSHATILTGLLPPQHGVRGNGTFRLRAGAPALAEALRSAGYKTGAVVGSVVLDRATGLDRGFDVYDDNQRRGPRQAFQYLERGASQIEDAALATLASLRPPFFLWVHFYDPHVPWVAPARFGSGYDAEIAFADEAAGAIIDAARRRATGGLVVLAAADHGESLGEHGENQHGYTLHRGVLRVPLILSGPGIPPAKTVAATVGLVDVAPTLSELAGATLPGAQGRSLSRFFRDPRPQSPDEDADLWEETLHPLYDSGWAPLRGLLSSRWHFVDAPRPELYDRLADRDDRTDVSGENAETLEALRVRLRAAQAALGDAVDPEAAPAVTPEEKERRERLASLGYVSAPAGPAPASGRLDPKDGLPGFLAVERAEIMIEEGRGAEARDLLAPHLRHDPGNPRLWHTLSKARLQAGDASGAEEAIRRALSLTPGYEFLRYTHANILRHRGDEEGVRAELTAIVHDNPRAVEASLELAAIASRRKDLAGSERILRAAYDAGARDPALCDRLGQHMNLQGRQAEAKALFAEALDLWPDDPDALLAAGRADLRDGDVTQAIAKLGRCASGSEAVACRMELARAYVLGPRDLAAARRELAAARARVTSPKLAAEIDQRLADIDRLGR